MTREIQDLKTGDILSGGWVVLSVHRKERSGWEIVYAKFNELDDDVETRRKTYALGRQQVRLGGDDE